MKGWFIFTYKNYYNIAVFLLLITILSLILSTNKLKLIKIQKLKHPSYLSPLSFFQKRLLTVDNTLFPLPYSPHIFSSFHRKAHSHHIIQYCIYRSFRIDTTLNLYPF